MNYIALDLELLSEKQLDILTEYGISKIFTDIYRARILNECKYYIEEIVLDNPNEDYTEVLEKINKHEIKTDELVEWLERPMENYMRYAVEEEFYVDEYILAEELEKIVDEIIKASQEGK